MWNFLKQFYDFCIKLYKSVCILSTFQRFYDEIVQLFHITLSTSIVYATFYCYVKWNFNMVYSLTDDTRM